MNIQDKIDKYLIDERSGGGSTRINYKPPKMTKAEKKDQDKWADNLFSKEYDEENKAFMEKQRKERANKLAKKRRAKAKKEK